MSAVMDEGAAVEQREFGPITSEMLVRYSGASGDFNPMHYDKDFAVSAGYPGVFAHGMYQAALLATYVTELPGVEVVHEFGVRFRDQVWPGDVLRCSAEVTATETVETGRRLTLALTMKTGDDRVVVTGQAEVGAAQ